MEKVTGAATDAREQSFPARSTAAPVTAPVASGPLGPLSPATGRRVRDLPITPAKLLIEEPNSALGGRRGADGSRE